AFPVSHRGSDSFGFLFEERTRRPFLVEQAEALGVPAGPVRRTLASGQPITLADGRQVSPDQVLGPEERGVKFVHVGDCGDTRDLVKIARGADALVIESTYLQEEAEMAHEFGHLTATQAATLAREAGVGHLLLTHISRRHRERDVVEEAQRTFPNTFVARDFDQFRVLRGETCKIVAP
ncbi:MAG: ribonuclease Z, partial [Anaerolineales bacterium]|nr:ribonuclease Z [Anaerolineales bacterium]